MTRNKKTSSSKKSPLERLQKVSNDVDLARLFRTGVEGIKIDGFGVETLRRWLKGVQRRRFYKPFTISKRSGEDRLILAPYYELKTAQRVLNLILNDAYRPRQATHGYVKGHQRGIVSNAKTHERQRWVLRVDLEDFFSSVHLGRVRGLLLKEPFSLQADVAEMVAKLCTYPIKPWETILPQGAPTSPVLTNFICLTLDRDLTALARRYRCYYSRYADDLVFSTDRNSFPTDLAVLGGEGVQVGKVLSDAILSHGFRTNPNKTMLRRNSSRQLVTGLVVNEKVNVPRPKIMRLKAMLHSWETEGLEAASQKFRQQYDTKNRPPGLEKPDFRQVVRGQVRFIASVKGYSDPVYLKLAAKLNALDPQFMIDPKGKRIEPTKLVLFTEGKTDRKHIAAALEYFQSLGRYETLLIELHDQTEISGDDDLLKTCKHYKEREQSHLSIFVFDRDVPKRLGEVQDPDGSFKDWGNRVVSLAIPVPPHREEGEPICIEHYYNDKDLTRKDVHGRRMYLISEFDPKTGKHREKHIFRRGSSKTLIVDDNVYSFTREGSIALSKDGFAEAIRTRTKPFNRVDFSGFEVLFDQLIDVAEKCQ